MNPQELCSRLNGVIGFPVTPFNDDHSLDLDGHRENVRYMLEQPMCALVAAGGTGELYSLDPDEVRQVVELFFRPDATGEFWNGDPAPESVFRRFGV